MARFTRTMIVAVGRFELLSVRTARPSMTWRLKATPFSSRHNSNHNAPTQDDPRGSP
jgi:hypothetical protein